MKHCKYFQCNSSYQGIIDMISIIPCSYASCNWELSNIMVRQLPRLSNATVVATVLGEAMYNIFQLYKTNI